jgi:CheY-like chemotaxis protein
VSQDFHVLLMEHDEQSLRRMTDVLGSFGLYANGYTDSAEAVHAVETNPFDGIFVEADMFDSGSAELARHARSSVINESTPIVFLANNEQSSMMTRAFSVGGSFFIVKPSDRHQLRSLLELTRLAMLEQKKRCTTIPFTRGVACAVGDECFVANAASLSETLLSVQRHLRLEIGTTAQISFRIPSGWCFYANGTVSEHEGNNSQLQLRLTHLDRFRLRAFIRSAAGLS